MAGLENLLISPYLKRRIRRRVIRDYQAGEHKNPSHPFTIAPANTRSQIIPNVLISVWNAVVFYGAMYGQGNP